MSELDYYKLPQFVERVSKGHIGPQLPIRISNMRGNQTHNISFLDHCDELCKKHNTDRLRLLSVIQQKLNGDMIVRLNESPVFKDKVKHVLSEWGEDVDPIELFRCPNDCYDNNNFNELKHSYQRHNDTLDSLNLNADNLESSIYNSVDNLRNDFHSCEDILRDNLSQIETRQHEYEPKYRAILCDLSTRQKPFYLDGLMESEEQANMIHHVNRKVNRHIPDNINIIFLNIVLIPTLIAKEMERLRNESLKMRAEIEKRQKILSDIMERVGPDEPVSFGFLKMLSDLTSVFGDDNELPSDDDEDEDDNMPEDKIENVMQNIIDKNEKSKVSNESDEKSDKMYYLNMKPKSDSLVVHDDPEVNSEMGSLSEVSGPNEVDNISEDLNKESQSDTKDEIPEEDTTSEISFF